MPRRSPDYRTIITVTLLLLIAGITWWVVVRAPDFGGGAALRPLAVELRCRPRDPIGDVPALDWCGWVEGIGIVRCPGQIECLDCGGRLDEDASARHECLPRFPLLAVKIDLRLGASLVPRDVDQGQTEHHREHKPQDPADHRIQNAGLRISCSAVWDTRASASGQPIHGPARHMSC